MARGGACKRWRGSRAKRRGVKRHDGQFVKCGEVLVRQCGTKILPGRNVGVGSDYTLYALIDGVVRFTKKRKDGRERTVVNVEPMVVAQEAPSFPSPSGGGQ